MTAQFFIDTNILLYAASKAPENRAKHQIALAILSYGGIGVSAQVMQEFYVAARRKAPLQITPADALAVLHAIMAFPVLPVSPDIVLDAIALHQRLQISYWDAAILVAAKRLSCHTVYSEDLNHGQDYDGVRVVNPFIATSATP